MRTEKLKNADVPAIVNVSEFMRRMSEMNSFYRMGEDAADVTLVVNTANAAVQALKGAEAERARDVALAVYYLALSAYKQLSPEESEAFTQINARLMQDYLKK